jgi:hypothetical protein
MPPFARALQADAARLGRAGRPARQTGHHEHGGQRRRQPRRPPPRPTVPGHALFAVGHGGSLAKDTPILSRSRPPSARFTTGTRRSRLRKVAGRDGLLSRTAQQRSTETADVPPRRQLRCSHRIHHRAGGWGRLDALQGFREFLLTKIGTESRVAWPWLVRWLVEPIGHNDTKPWQPRSRPRRGGHDEARRTAGRVPRNPRRPRRTDTGLRRVPRHARTPRRQLRRLTGSRTSRGCTTSTHEL